MVGRERGWVAVSVRTYHSHRSSQQQQRVLQQDYTVDETGATLNAVSRSSDLREEERLLAQASSSAPTTSIFIRDWKVMRSPGRGSRPPPFLTAACKAPPRRPAARARLLPSVA